MKKKKILLTAFEPFLDLEENLSSSAVRAFKNRRPKSLRVKKLILPTSYRRAEELILAAMEKEKPDGVVSFGVALNSPAVRVERFALNIDDAEERDVDGASPKGRPISRRAPAAYRTDVKVERIRSALKRKGIPAVVSNHAGAYVCNHLYFTVLREIREAPLETKAVFIHLPISASESIRRKGRAPYITLETAVEVVRAAVDTLSAELV